MSRPWTYLPSTPSGPLVVDRAFYDRLARETASRTLVDRFVVPDPIGARLARPRRPALPDRDRRGSPGGRLQRLAPPQPARALLGVPDEAAPPSPRHDGRPALVDPAVPPPHGDDHERHAPVRDRRRRRPLPRSPRDALRSLRHEAPDGTGVRLLLPLEPGPGHRAVAAHRAGRPRRAQRLPGDRPPGRPLLHEGEPRAEGRLLRDLRRDRPPVRDLDVPRGRPLHSAVGTGRARPDRGLPAARVSRSGSRRPGSSPAGSRPNPPTTGATTGCRCPRPRLPRPDEDGRGRSDALRDPSRPGAARRPGRRDAAVVVAQSRDHRPPGRRHPGPPQARALPAHGHVQAAGGADGDAGARPRRARPWRHGRERGQSRHRRRVRGARPRHDGQGRDAANRQRRSRRRVPELGRGSRSRGGRAPGVRAGSRDRSHRGPHLRPSVRGTPHGARNGHARTRAGRSGAGSRRRDRADRRRRTLRRRRDRRQARHAPLPGLRGRAGGRGLDAPKSRSGLAAVDRRRADDRRQPGRAARRAVQLRAVPPGPRRSRARERRGAQARNGPALSRGQAGRRAGRRRGHGGAPGPPRGAAARSPGRRDRLRVEPRRDDLRAPRDGAA